VCTLRPLGAFLAAQEKGWPFVYVANVGGRSILHVFRSTREQKEEEIPEILNIDDYLKAHGFWDYVERSTGKELEKISRTRSRATCRS
jgi:hypothetical protein